MIEFCAVQCILEFEESIRFAVKPNRGKLTSHPLILSLSILGPAFRTYYRGSVQA